jgi:hypothetical protein
MISTLTEKYSNLTFITLLVGSVRSAEEEEEEEEQEDKISTQALEVGLWLNVFH